MSTVGAVFNDAFPIISTPDLQRALGFYRDLLGFQEVGRIFNGAAAALTSGRTHHELLLIQVGDAPGPPSGRRRGLYHIGIKVGDSLD